MPTFGFALAATTVSTYLPVLVADAAGSATAIAALIAVEGVLALFLPVVVGARSDRLRTRIGGRLPFVARRGPGAWRLALVLLGLPGRAGPALAIVIVLFAAYYVAYEPYRALYPDLVPVRDAGRSQSAQAVARGHRDRARARRRRAAPGDQRPRALRRGGGRAAGPTVAPSSGSCCAATPAPAGAGRRDAARSRPSGEVRHLLAELPGLRAFFVANALWEAALAAIRTFVVLWVTVGLGLGVLATAGVIGGAGVCVLVGAALAGRLAERFGTRRVVRATAVDLRRPR